MDKGNSKRCYSEEYYPILFKEKKKKGNWTKSRLVTDITGIINEGLFNEYFKLFYEAPKRGNVEERNIFEDEHKGRVGKGPIKTSADGTIKFTEKRLARAIWNFEKLTFPKGHGFIRLLDYEFPLQATGDDKAIGEVDLLGLTDGGVLSVIELKYLNLKEGSDASDSPLYALVEALRYSAIIEANLVFVKDAMARKKAENAGEERWSGEIKSDKPRILLIANKRWWNYWDERDRQKKKGKWKKIFIELLAAIKEELGIEIKCYSINDYSEKDIDWQDENKPFLLSDPELKTWPFSK